MLREPRHHLADDECDVRCRTMPLKVRQRLAGADKWRAMAFGLPIRVPALRPLPPGTGGSGQFGRGRYCFVLLATGSAVTTSFRGGSVMRKQFLDRRA